MRTVQEIKEKIDYLEKQKEQLAGISRVQGVDLSIMIEAVTLIDKQIDLLKWVLNDK